MRLKFPKIRSIALTIGIFAGVSTPGYALNILVGNDDSCNSEGVNILMDALEAAGHTVTMYSPAGEQSGKSSSASTNLFKAYVVSNVGFEGPTGADNRYCVRVPTESPEEGSEEEFIASASPRDSIAVGLEFMQDSPPDLVVTGINRGQNTGKVAVASGTVGGAVAAIQAGIPAIAVSRHRFATAEGLTIEQGANFIVALVAELEAKRIEGQPLLPAFTGLNVNTPVGTPRGVAHTSLGYDTDLLFGPTLTDGEVIVGYNGILQLSALIGEEAAAELEANPNATVQDFADAGLDTNDETSMYVANYITITTLNGDYTATLRKREVMQVKLRDLTLGE